MKRKILNLLDGHRIMTLATLRPDGWPQATTVGYVNEGLTLWFLCGLESQKAHNLARDDRVSLTIGHDTPDIMAITVMSMAARAPRDRPRGSREGAAHDAAEVPGRIPGHGAAEDACAAGGGAVPEVISVLDYTQGFAHTDLVTC